MRKTYLIIIIALTLSKVSFSQGKFEDYQRAEKFLHFNVYNLVQNLYLNPNWIDETSDFWYKTEIENGHRFMLVSSSKNEVELAFDHHKLAIALEKELDKEINPDSLPFSKIKFKDSLKTVAFKIDTINYKYNIKKKIYRNTHHKKMI